MLPKLPESNDTVVFVASMKKSPALAYRFFEYSANSPCAAEGCPIMFNANSHFQYLPSNSDSYSMVLSGNIMAQYENGAVAYYTNPYTDNWSDYRDVWNYDESVKIYLKSLDQKFLSITHVNATADLYTFNGAKIVGSEISKTTQSNAYVYIFGSDYSYKVDGEEVEFRGGVDKPYRAHSLPGGNTHTHTFTANSTPITIFVIEKR